MTDLRAFSASSLRDAIAAGETTARRAVDASFDRMRDVGAGKDGLNILLYQDRHDALTRAAECDAGDPAARGRPLNGVPVVVKDNIATSVMPTSCGSKILMSHMTRTTHMTGVIAAQAANARVRRQRT